MSPAVALLAHDPEVAQLEAAALAHEHVQRRQVPVEQLPAVQLSQHLEDARDLPPRHRLRPSLARAPQEGAQVALACVLQGQAVEDAAFRRQERERVEDPDGPGVAVQELAEVGLAHPTVDPLADLDADRGRNARQRAEPAREVRLAEPTFPEQAPHPVAHPALRAGDDLVGREEMARRLA
jgi:hypothetical protein